MSDPIKELLAKYRKKGFQTMSLDEYYAHKKRESRIKKMRLPNFLKWVIYTPFILIFCFGLLFIPIITYQVFTKPAKDGHLLTDKTPTYSPRSKRSRRK